MKRFYLQQFSAASLIVGVWVLLIVCLTRDSRGPAVVDPPVAVVTREKFEPRDERTGEVCRIHRFDDLENRTQVEIKFIDKTRAVLHFNAFGRRSRAEEFQVDGSRQVFTFARDGQRLVKHQSYRADGSLKSEAVPAGKDSSRTTRFSDDGKTRVSEQVRLGDGTLVTTVFLPDGKTPKMGYRQTGLRSELTMYENGVKRSHDTIERHPGGMGMMGMGMMGMMPVTMIKVQNVTFQADGKTVWFKQNWTVINGSPLLNEMEEMHGDGKTVKHRFQKVRVTMQQPFIGIRRPGTIDERLTLESFDANGIRLSTRTLRPDFTVDSEVIYGGDGKPESREPAAGVKVLEERLLKAPPGCQIDNLINAVSPALEPHHLQQILTD